jgi:hypothetical protein
MDSGETFSPSRFVRFRSKAATKQWHEMKMDDVNTAAGPFRIQTEFPVT